MIQQPKPTDKQIELIKKLDELKFKIWKTNSTKEVIAKGKEAIDLSRKVTPTAYILANGNHTMGDELDYLFREYR